MKRIRQSLAASAALACLSMAAAGNAHADAFAQAILTIDNFRLLHASGAVYNRTDFRAGLSYETSGIPQEWVSPLTYDANKVIGGAGASLYAGEN